MNRVLWQVMSPHLQMSIFFWYTELYEYLQGHGFGLFSRCELFKSRYDSVRTKMTDCPLDSHLD